MLRSIIIILVSLYYVQCYFTLPGKCPENVKVMEEFRLNDFFEKWHQSYHYSSDGRNRNNCSVSELIIRPTGIHLNQSRVDVGLVHRYSIGKIEIPTRLEDAANMNVTFTFEHDGRRVKSRSYPFQVLATNYNYYATVYTCQYSPSIDKHFVYVWLLSRNPILNDVSKELALRPLRKLGITDNQLVRDDWSKCTPKYWDDNEEKPMTFQYPIYFGN